MIKLKISQQARIRKELLLPNKGQVRSPQLTSHLMREDWDRVRMSALIRSIQHHQGNKDKKKKE